MLYVKHLCRYKQKAGPETHYSGPLCSSEVLRLPLLLLLAFRGIGW